MRKLHFKYSMTIEYTVPVSRCNFTIKCVPKDTERQKVENINISINPTNKYNFGVDGFRNIQVYGVNEQSHDRFDFKIEGDVITGLADYEEYVDDDIAMIFNHPYGHCVAGECINEYYSKIGKNECEGMSAYDKAIYMMHKLHKHLTYKSFSTDIHTSAEQSFKQGMGVCQDFAHIYIAIMHLMHIPARYVTGLIIGEGESHAWVEVLIEGKWYGIDPTNDKAVNDEYIKIGVGRDASDCKINRGIMHGGGLHYQTINVTVEDKN